MEVNEIIGRLRCKGYTQVILAYEMAVSQSMIHQVIYGQSRSQRIRMRIAEIIGKDVHSIWPEKG